MPLQSEDIFLGKRQSINSPRRLFYPAPREPLYLPRRKIEIPLPPQAPPPPPALNWWTTILPPILMLLGTVIGAVANSQSLAVMIPMFMMSLGFPIANLLGLRAQRKAYQEEIKKRAQSYQKQLGEIRLQLESLAQQQIKALEDAYPNLNSLRQIAQLADKRLWTRRTSDEDFLNLRIGCWEGLPSFTVEAPRYADKNDPLVSEAITLASEFQKISNVPYLLNLPTTGSLAIHGRGKALNALIYRLVLDLLVHHSPQDIRLIVLSDTTHAARQWEWLKWAPHTDLLNEENRNHSLSFDYLMSKKVLETVVEEFRSRHKQQQGWNAPVEKHSFQPALVLIIDDEAKLRQDPNLRSLAEKGHEVAIYSLFIGGHDLPRECRGRLELMENDQFRFVKTSRVADEPQTGTFEKATPEDCDEIVRSLAGWTVMSGDSHVPLPESIRLSKVLGTESITVEGIQQAWSKRLTPQSLLQFPIGVAVKPDGLEQAVLNLLPAEHGGKDAYHTILIGTTGSGKSEFMKSLVFGAAVRYPPSVLNFFFMDFKGGAAFNIFADLPHVSGIVTNLSPDLVERGIDSIRNEIDRRQVEFVNASTKKRIQNIWDYNRACPDHSLPHLILFLDEFARGLADFPRLRETLDVLVRQGRSLGMYLILANQDVNAEVDKLLNNVGWRIALKVAKPEEMHIIDRTLPSPTRAGQGYLCLSSGTSDILEFQAGYGGFPLQNEGERNNVNDFHIYQVDSSGIFREVWKSSVSSSFTKESITAFLAMKEEEFILRNIRQTAESLGIQPAKRIYLDPLPTSIDFGKILQEAGIQPGYQNKKWNSKPESSHIIAYWGKIDIPEQCLQHVLVTDFDEKDGNLWLIGAPKSGIDLALTTLIMSLAITYPPDQVQFYMLELGAGELSLFENLPHTGAVIYPQRDNALENERFARLLNFLDREMQKRTRILKEKKAASAIQPSIFIVINSYAELRANFPDETEHMIRFVRDGSRLGIHFIFTTARGPELTRSFSNIIARRLVLQLSSNEDYFDVVGKQVSPLRENIPGRGYWVDDGVALCQIATLASNLDEQILHMRKAWKGQLPAPIEILPSNIPLSNLLQSLCSPKASGEVYLPVGKAYETLECVSTKLVENPSWLILGPRECGKSNFLACAALSVLEQDVRGQWDIRAYALRRSPINSLSGKLPRLSVLTSVEEIVKDCQHIVEGLKSRQENDDKRLLLLIDDLGAAFQPGREALATMFNTLGTTMENTGGIVLMASGLLEELRMQLASPLVKYLRQNRTGLVLSKDMSEADWLGASIPFEYRRMEFPTGRGFFVYKGRCQLLQTPLMDG